MFRFAQRFGRRSQASHARTRRPRSFNASLEAVEDRTLMSTLSAIYCGPGQGSVVFGIGSGGSVYMNKDESGFVSLGGNVTQISASLDAAGKPEVFGIGGGNVPDVNDNGGSWVSLGGYVTAISAAADNTVFGIGGGNAVFVNHGSGWTSLGGNVVQISAGLDGATGKPEVYAIGGNNAAYVNDNGTGWVNLGGYVTELSAMTDSSVYVRGQNVGNVYVNSDGVGFGYVGSTGTPNPNPSTSGNWSGYVAETNFSNPQQNSVSAVSGSWIVPTVTGPSTGATYSATWVGIDGSSSSNKTVEQVGTEEDWVNGSPDYYAWWEMYSSVDKQPEQVISSMKVVPGDVISASVLYITSGTQAGQFELSITDSSRSNDSFTTYQTSSQTQNPLAQRSSAEWIVEATSINGSTGTLANFGTTYFADATAVINGVSGPINSPSWQSQAVDIVSNGTYSDTTSALINSGDSFVVRYNGSSGPSALTGSQVESGERSGATAGAANTSAQKVIDQALTELAALEESTPRRAVVLQGNGSYRSTFSHTRFDRVTATATADGPVG